MFGSFWLLANPLECSDVRDSGAVTVLVASLMDDLCVCVCVCVCACVCVCMCVCVQFDTWLHDGHQESLSDVTLL